jgi:hypothetical protein
VDHLARDDSGPPATSVRTIADDRARSRLAG